MTSIGNASIASTSLGQTSLGTASFYDNAIAGMADLRAQTDRLQAQISTGNRLQSATQDPLAAARLRALAQSDALAAADSANADAAKTRLSLTDSTMTQLSTIVTRIQTLATQAANGTLNKADRADIGAQIAADHDQMVALANTRDAYGQPLFGGQAGGGAAYTLDASGNAAYAGSPAAPTLAIGNGMTVTAGITGPQLFGSGASDLLAATKALADALQGGSGDPAGAARAALDGLSSGLDTLAAAQATVGARLAFIGTAQSLSTAFAQQRATDEATIGGTDVATAVSRLQQTMTVLQASQASFVKLSGLTLFSALS